MASHPKCSLHRFVGGKQQVSRLDRTGASLTAGLVERSAGGLLATFGRLSGIVAPIAARPYIANNSNGLLWLAVGGIWLSALVLVFLPIETRKRASY